jgi:hypothetical protein
MVTTSVNAQLARANNTSCMGPAFGPLPAEMVSMVEPSSFCPEKSSSCPVYTVLSLATGREESNNGSAATRWLNHDDTEALINKRGGKNDLHHFLFCR